MEKKFYLDISVWIDYLENRRDGIRPLGEFAFQFLKKCRKEKAKIIVSDIVIDELERYISKERIKELLLEFSDLIIKVEHSEKQAEETEIFWEKTKKTFPMFDILHSIIAKAEEAILVSRDRHFNEIGLCENKLPEELL